MLVFKMADAIVAASNEGGNAAYILYEGPLVSRAEARAAGLSRYFTGKPCPQGHIVERRTSNWKCLQCGRDEFSAMMRADPARNRVRAKLYADRHPEKVKTRKQRWAADNESRIIAYRVKYRLHNADLLKTSQRNYYRDNRDHVLAKSAEWQRANVDRVKVKNARWASANPDTVRSIVRRRRARLRGADGNHTGSDILALFEQQHGRCAACFAAIANGYHVDHMMPLSRGGSNGPENLQLLCQACNCSKGARTMEEWARHRYGMHHHGNNSCRINLHVRVCPS